MAEIGETRRYEPDPDIPIHPRNSAAGSGNTKTCSAAPRRQGTPSPFGRRSRDVLVMPITCSADKVRHPANGVGRSSRVEGDDEDRGVSVSFRLDENKESLSNGTRSSTGVNIPGANLKLRRHAMLRDRSVSGYIEARVHSSKAYRVTSAAGWPDRAESMVATQLFRCKSIDHLLSDSKTPSPVKKVIGLAQPDVAGNRRGHRFRNLQPLSTAIAGQKFQASSILNAPLLEYSFTIRRRLDVLARARRLRSLLSWWLSLRFASVCYPLAAMILSRQRVHLHVCRPWGNSCLDYRLGLDPRVTPLCNMAVQRPDFRSTWLTVMGLVRRASEPRWISPLPPQRISPISQGKYSTGRWHFGFNWPAFIIVMILTVICSRHRESAETNNVM